MRPPPSLASPVTGDTSLVDQSRLRGTGLLAGFAQHLQAALGDAVVLVPPSVSRTRVPLDGTLVLQLLDGIVVADTVRPDARASSRHVQGQVGT